LSRRCWDFHRRLLAEGIKCGEFRNIDPVLFYTSLIGACDICFLAASDVARDRRRSGHDDVCRNTSSTWKR